MQQEKSPIQQTPAPTPDISSPWVLLLKRVWRRIENVVFGFILLLIILYFVLQLSPVQNWLIQKAGNYLSEELQTTVKVGHVDIAFFDHLALEQVLITDRKGDTLIYAGQISAGFKYNFFTALNKYLVLNDLDITNAKVHLDREVGEYEHNIDFLLDYFGGGSSQNKKKPGSFDIKIQNFRLHNVEFVQDDRARGEKMRVLVPQANIRINQLDIPAKVANLESVQVSDLLFKYEKHPHTPLPKRPKVALSPEDSIAKANRPKRPFLVQVQHLDVSGARLAYDRFRAEPPKEMEPGVMDFDHLWVQGIDIKADSLFYSTETSIAGQLKHFAAKEKSGLSIQHIEAQKFVLNDTLTDLQGLRLETGGSLMTNRVQFRYDKLSAFNHFNNEVTMNLDLSEACRLRLGDLQYFKNMFARNTFLKKNKDLVAEISGNISGKLNDLKGTDLKIKAAGTTIAASFKGDDLARSADLLRLSVKVDQLESNIATLRDLIPGFKPPKTFESLGYVRFAGNYDLMFGYNHILKGDISTSVGKGDLDMELDMTNGSSEATYSGQLNMSRFDLGTWTGNKDLGKSAFHIRILEPSKGMSLSSLDVRVQGMIDTLRFRGYTYKSISMDGIFKEKLFDGALKVKDPNIDLSFDGSMDFREAAPVYSFGADVRSINLGNLNLIKEDVIASAKIEKVRLTGNSFSSLIGSAMVRDIQLLQDLEDRRVLHRIDSVAFVASKYADDLSRFSINSDVLNANVEGQFRFDNAVNHLLRTLNHNFPAFTRQMNYAVDSTVLTDKYAFNFYIKDTKELTKLFDTALDTLRDIKIDGRVDAQAGITHLSAAIPYLHYGSIRSRNMSFGWDSQGDQATYGFSLPELTLSKRYKLSPLRLAGNVDKDKVRFGLQTQDPTAIVQNVDLRGVLTLPDSVFQVQFNSSNFDLFNEKWAISEDNYIRFGSNYIDTEGLFLSSGDRRIALEDINEGTGIKFISSNFDLGFLNKILPARNITYRGRLSDFDAEINNVFKMEGIRIFISTDTVFLNNQAYGRIDGNIDLPTLSDPLEWNLSARDQAFNLKSIGAWMLGGKEARQPLNPAFDNLLRPGEIESQLEGSNFPMSILQQFVGGISETEGRFDIKTTILGKVSGSSPTLGLSGNAMIRSGSFKIDYLNTRYFIKNQPVAFTDYFIKAPSVDTIADENGKLATITGGLRHNFFRKWQIECTVASIGNDFLILKTNKKLNPVYYGTGIGKFVAKFDGTFSSTNIKITATTGTGTKMFIPLSDEAEVKEVNFIRFKSRDAKLPGTPTPLRAQANRRFQSGDLKGLSIELNLSLTEQAQMELIFDEQAGDILSGKGRGNISLIINREGEFKMYGAYTITEGKYLFTLLNFVNKPFKVENGGTIIWYGDPYGAQIDLKANYEVNTSVINLINEELALNPNANLTADAGRATKVGVKMAMTGDLFKPDIGFDMEFLNLSPQLKNFTDNKLRLLHQDPNEMNRQVFGLIVFGTFLPQDAFAPQSVGTAFNTITQFLGSQLSNYLSSLASDWFGGNVSSFDLAINYNENDNILNNDGGVTSTSRQVAVSMTSGFKNDRVTIQIGTQLGSAPVLNNNNGFLGEDVVIEIQPTENRQWRVKAYQRLEPDITGGTLRNRFGLGISYRKEFNSFAELRQDLIKSSRHRK